MSYDLIIRNARVIDPASGMDVVGDVAVLDGVIVSGMCAIHTSDCGVASGDTITQRSACSSTFVNPFQCRPRLVFMGSGTSTREKVSIR
jgi:uncharacterized ferredoxin-like protein